MKTRPTFTVHVKIRTSVSKKSTNGSRTPVGPPQRFDSLLVWRDYTAKEESSTYDYMQQHTCYTLNSYEKIDSSLHRLDGQPASDPDQCRIQQINFGAVFQIRQSYRRSFIFSNNQHASTQTRQIRNRFHRRTYNIEFCDRDDHYPSNHAQKEGLVANLIKQLSDVRLFQSVRPTGDANRT